MRVKDRINIILIFCLLLFNIKSVAQISGSIEIDLNAGTKSFPSHGRFGKGISAEYSKTFSRHSSLRAYLGYNKFDQKFPGIDPMTVEDSIVRIGLRGYGLAWIPLRIGYQYQVSNKLPFLYGETGFAHVITKYENQNLPGNVLTYALGIEYRQTVSSGIYVQLGISFNHYDLKQFGARNCINLRLAFGLAHNNSRKE